MLIKLIFFLSVCLLCLGATVSDKRIVDILLNLNHNNYKIKPVVENPSDVTTLVLKGKVPVLRCGFCEALPNINYFESTNVSMEVIKNSAFHKCKRLEQIIMYNNKFKKIEKNSFRGLKKLTDLHLNGGNVPVFDVDFSDSTELNFLDLSYLNITTFSVNSLRGQKHLEVLDLYSNNLFDLDVENLLRYTPNLRTIYLAKNNFKCSRLEEIISLLKEKNVQASTYNFYAKTQDNTTGTIIDGIHCLSDEQWSELYLRNVPRL